MDRNQRLSEFLFIFFMFSKRETVLFLLNQITLEHYE
jgi:hypothetical protein